MSNVLFMKFTLNDVILTYELIRIDIHNLPLPSLRILQAYHLHLCSTDTSIMEPCRIRNVSNTCVVCIFKNLPRVHVSYPFQHCRAVQHRPSPSSKPFQIQMSKPVVAQDQENSVT